MVFLWCLIAATFIDFDTQLLPDAITLPGVLAGLGGSLVSQRVTWVDSVGGVLLGGALFVAVIVLLAARPRFPGPDAPRVKL